MINAESSILSPITLVLLDINTGITQLLNGAIIVVKDYADNLNKDLYIRYNSTTNLSIINNSLAVLYMLKQLDNHKVKQYLTYFILDNQSDPNKTYNDFKFGSDVTWDYSQEAKK